ncbi:hypothetical protein PL373_06015 [Tenacibaculum maritimum]|nr:hypothetical protein [Tenacibaculum maritimum]MDB0600706.1 hypothetical protein [Tenacibaculum maritimum]MDB0612689.1 hypothetical protein [Tenacibaculum maritimum]
MSNTLSRHLYKVLAYSKLHTQELTVFERMLIHQHINQNYSLTVSIQHKITTISKKIAEENWKVPEYRYNQDRVIEVYNTEKYVWEVFKKNISYS